MIRTEGYLADDEEKSVARMLLAREMAQEEAEPYRQLHKSVCGLDAPAV
jgi:hypothetical protein